MLVLQEVNGVLGAKTSLIKNFYLPPHFKQAVHFDLWRQLNNINLL